MTGTDPGYRARCQCGALSIICASEPLFTAACHCWACQRKTGSRLGAGVFFPARDGSVHGASRVWARQSDAGRRIFNHFCPRCGTTLYWETEKRPDVLVVALGCFDGVPPRPTHAFWTREKPDWLGLSHDIVANATQ